MLIKLSFWDLPACPDHYCDWSKENQSVHDFLSFKVNTWNEQPKCTKNSRVNFSWLLTMYLSKPKFTLLFFHRFNLNYILMRHYIKFSWLATQGLRHYVLTQILILLPHFYEEGVKKQIGKIINLLALLPRSLDVPRWENQSHCKRYIE